MAVKFNPFTGNLDLVDVASVSAAGSDTQVQFNNAGALGGSADLTWDDTGKLLTVGGDIDLDDGGTYATTLQVITPTADRTISYPDATGTLALVAGSSGQLIYNNAGANAGLSTAAIGATGDVTLSLAGAASTPPLKLTGTWFSGGTGTTTTPQLLIDGSATPSTAWSTSGTGLGINAASGFAGNLLDLQVNGTSRARIDSSGNFFPFDSTSYRADGVILFNQQALLSDNKILRIASGSFYEAIGIEASDCLVSRDAADTLAQRRGTNAQTYRLYNSYTDASSYQRTSITDDSTGLVIDQQYAGTGAARTNLLDLKNNGTSNLTVSSAGALRAASLAVGSSSIFHNLSVTSPGLNIRSDWVIRWYNGPNLIAGGAYDVALARDQAGVVAITDGSTGTGYLKQTPVAVSALPAAATVGAGTRGFVSDSTVAASGNFGATVTGGGSNNVPVFSDGTNWLIG